jgi:hypothetical protein
MPGCDDVGSAPPCTLWLPMPGGQGPIRLDLVFWSTCFVADKPLDFFYNQPAVHNSLISAFGSRVLQISP